jgi:hypothetical protein
MTERELQELLELEELIASEGLEEVEEIEEIEESDDLIDDPPGGDRVLPGRTGWFGGSQADRGR